MVLYYIQMYQFIHYYGGVLRIKALTAQVILKNMEGLVINHVKFPIEIHILEIFWDMEILQEMEIFQGCETF